jgi:hypothetical protein
LRSESLPKAAVIDALESVFGIVKTLITASNMTSTEKRDLLATIGSWRTAVATVATKAGRQLSMSTASGNGDNSDNGHDEED